MRRKVTLVLLITSMLLSLKSFSQLHQDCDNPYPICNKQTYQFLSITGLGKKKDLLGNPRCSKEIHETNSLWLKWKVKSAGVLTFYIDPANQTDDIDFILFKENQKNCADITEVRCMASGTSQLINRQRNNNCLGATGLNYQSIDEFEKSGCKYDSDNFLKFLSVQEGEEFLLFINNYNNQSGISFSIDGDAELELRNNCPDIVQELPMKILEMTPNPTSNNIQINYQIQNPGKIKIELFNIAGKRLWEGQVDAGKGINRHLLHTELFASGSYLIRMTHGDYSTIRQFIKI